MVVVVVGGDNFMPIYKTKCEKCDHEATLYLGMLVSGSVVNIPCPFCGHKVMKKMPEQIISANFSKGSRKSLNTRTGVGEVQFAKGADKIIEEANKS